MLMDNSFDTRLQEPKNKLNKSKYPIKEGYVFLLREKRKRFNKEINACVNHYVFVWILRFGKRKFRGQPKNRPVKVVMLAMPALQGFEEKTIIWENTVQFRTITRLLSKGYNVISDKVPFNYNRWNFKKFYQVVGLL